MVVCDISELLFDEEKGLKPTVAVEKAGKVLELSNRLKPDEADVIIGLMLEEGNPEVADDISGFVLEAVKGLRLVEVIGATGLIFSVLERLISGLVLEAGKRLMLEEVIGAKGLIFSVLERLISGNKEITESFMLDEEFLSLRFLFF